MIPTDEQLKNMFKNIPKVDLRLWEDRAARRFRYKAQLSVLRDVQKEFGGLTIENIIQQIESIIKKL